MDPIADLMLPCKRDPEFKCDNDNMKQPATTDEHVSEHSGYID
jgi:hypothetical protein